MKTYILNISNQIKNWNNTIDATSVLCSHSWLVFNDDGVKEIYIFRRNGSLLASHNGKVTKARWEYIATNTSILIDIPNSEAFMLKPYFYDEKVLALMQDGTNHIALLIGENYAEELALNNLEKATSYITTQKVKRDEEEKEKVRINNVKNKKRKEIKKTIIGLCIAIICLILYPIIIVPFYNFIAEKAVEFKENRKLNPDILVTESQNRIAIDLGLSVKWATCNVGANSPEETGNYYGWGDPTGLDIYNPHKDIVYQLLLRFPKREKENPPSTIIGTKHDIVKKNWGNSWRMPTQIEIRELLTKCTIEYCEYKGIKCAKFIGPNGNHIYIPSAGYKNGIDGKPSWIPDDKYNIYLWSGDIYRVSDDDNRTNVTSSHGASLYIKSEFGDSITIKVGWFERFENLPVRGVKD